MLRWCGGTPKVEGDKLFREMLDSFPELKWKCCKCQHSLPYLKCTAVLILVMPLRLVFHRTSCTAVLILVIVARAVVVITPTSFTHLMECLLRRVVECDDVVEFKVPMALNPNRLRAHFATG